MQDYAPVAGGAAVGKFKYYPCAAASPGVGGTRPPSEHGPGPEGAQLSVASSLGKGQEGCRSPLHTKTPGGEAPGGAGLRAAGQWLGWWRQEPRQAGPPWGLGQAGATGNHNNYKIKPFPLCGKTNNKNSTK